MILPDHADVANAIGAVVGRVRMHAEAMITAPSEGRFLLHLPEGQSVFLEARVRVTASGRPRIAEVEGVDIHLPPGLV